MIYQMIVRKGKGNVGVGISEEGGLCCVVVKNKYWSGLGVEASSCERSYVFILRLILQVLKKI